MTDDTMAGAGEQNGPASSALARSGPVLIALILLALVANMNLALANVALPDIGTDVAPGARVTARTGSVG
jgi:hypothetical protein